MITKAFTSILLILVLLCPSIESYAADPSESGLKELITLHQQLKTGVGSLELLIKKGPQLVEQTRLFLNQGQGSNWINTPQAQQLKIENKILVNFLTIQKALDECVIDKNAKRNLDKRILNSAYQSMNNQSEIISPCQKLLEENFLPLNISNISQDLLKISRDIIKNDFTKKLSEQVITNNAKSLLGYKLKFDPNFLYPSSQIDHQLSSIVDHVCLKRNQLPRKSLPPDDVCQAKLSPQFKKILLQKLKNDLPHLAPKEKITPELATNQINASVERLNQSLAKINVKTDQGFIFDSAQLENENTKSGFDQYITQYMFEVQNNAGTLLLSNELKKSVGEIKSLNEADTVKDHKTKKFMFTPHKKARALEVANAIKEIERKMEDHNQKTLSLALSSANNPKDQDESLALMVKNNPFAAGPVLLNNPQLTSQMCDSINMANNDDQRDEDLDKYFTVGAAVLGGAILLTGIGTLAGAYLLTGSLTAGVSAGTLGGSILGYTALAGSAVELASAGQAGVKAYQQHQEMITHEAAFLTSNGDKESLTDAKQALIEYKEARFSASLSLIGVGLGGAFAAKLFNLLNSGPTALSTHDVRGASKILKYLTNRQSAKKLKEVIQALGDRGSEKMEDFLIKLAKVSEKNRIKFLEKLNESAITPEKIKQIVEKSLQAAKSCKN